MTRKTRHVVRALGFLAVIVVTPLVVGLVAHTLGMRPPTWFLSTSALTVALAYTMIESLHEQREAERQRRLMYPRCVRCGYDLTGNETGTCHECGGRFR